MNQRTTMADLAKALAVAESTVSRALRGDPRISEATRQRVLETAREMDYRPNAMVSALMSMRRRHGSGSGIDTIALITDYQDDGGWRSKDVCRWEHDGICSRADALGYQIEEFALADYDHDTSRLEKALITRGIRGVLLGFSRDPTVCLSLDFEKFSIAGLSTYFHEVKVDRANFHGLYNVRLAMQRMQAMGCKRTGLVVPEFNNRISGYQWSSSALDWQRVQIEQQRCAPLIIHHDHSQLRFKEWLRDEQPDSLLVYKVPVHDWLEQTANPVTSDWPIAYLYRSRNEMSSAAGIDGNLPLVGAAALDLVVEALHTNRTGLPEHPKEVLIKGSWCPQPVEE